MRYLKTVGLAMMAVFAFSAVAASAASAQGMLTSDGPVLLDGTELEGNALTYKPEGSPAVTCNDTDFNIGYINDTETEHGFVEPPLTDFTAVPAPEYTECLTGGFFPTTVDMEECDFEFTIGETTEGEHTYGVHASLFCPEGQKVHVTTFSDAGHTNLICTTTFGAQTPTSDLHLTDETNGHLRLHGTATNIHATQVGSACGEETTSKEGIYHVNITVSGTNKAEETTEISLSHS